MKIEESFRILPPRSFAYCGGGNRSALVTNNLQKMGYENILSRSPQATRPEEDGLATES